MTVSPATIDLSGVFVVPLVKDFERINGQDIELQGSWKSGNRQYEAKYSGAFVRRHADLKGTQTWTDGGKSFTRACTGTIKRPFRVFLPGETK